MYGKQGTSEKSTQCDFMVLRILAIHDIQSAKVSVLPVPLVLF